MRHYRRASRGGATATNSWGASRGTECRAVGCRRRTHLGGLSPSTTPGTLDVLYVTDQVGSVAITPHSAQAARHSAASPTPSTEEPIDATSQQPIAEHPPALPRTIHAFTPPFMSGLPPRSARGPAGRRGACSRRTRAAIAAGLLAFSTEAPRWRWRRHRTRSSREPRKTPVGIRRERRLLSPAVKPCSCQTRCRTCPWPVRPWRRTTRTLGLSSKSRRRMFASRSLRRPACWRSPPSRRLLRQILRRQRRLRRRTYPRRRRHRRRTSCSRSRKMRGLGLRAARCARLFVLAAVRTPARSRILGVDSLVAPAIEPAPAAEAVPVAEPTSAQQLSAADRGAGRHEGRAVRSGRGAPEKDRFHTVRAGESLWSIASDLLGERGEYRASRARSTACGS